MKVQVCSIWKKKFWYEGQYKIRTYNPEDLVYHTNHQTTEILLDGREII